MASKHQKYAQVKSSRRSKLKTELFMGRKCEEAESPRCAQLTCPGPPDTISHAVMVSGIRRSNSLRSSFDWAGVFLRLGFNTWPPPIGSNSALSEELSCAFLLAYLGRVPLRDF